MKKLLLLLLSSIVLLYAKSQNVAINTDGSIAATSAMLDVKSTAKGLLIPRMSKVQRNGITSPSTGLLVYQNAPDSIGFYYYDGTIWQWLSTANDNNNNWKLTGNSGTNSVNNFIGTNDSIDIAFRVNNFERMRLSTEGELGIGENNPKYALDVKALYTSINNCANNGLRIKKPIAPNDCDKGLLIGYSSLALSGDNDALIWNYGNTVTGNSTDYNLIFGNQNSEYMRLTGGGLLGLGQIAPSYKIDADLDNAAPFNNPCVRNGLRLNFKTLTNDCDKGLFLGFDNVNLGDEKKISLWNFTANPTALNQYIRFGFGPDFGETDPSVGEVLRILPPGQGIGIGIQNPQAMIHIRNNLGGSILPGVMVTAQNLPINEKGFYSGIGTVSGNSSVGIIWNHQNAPTIFGTNDLERMRIAENGNIGINTSNPIARLHVVDSNVVFSANGSPIFPASPAPINGAGRRMFWYADKAAFRAGYVDGVQWDTDSIGVYSFAVGYNTKAKDYSTALGTDTKASNGSLSTGAYSIASGLYSFATGIVATAGGEASISTGYQTRALGNYSVAAGGFTGALNTYAVAMGYQSNASGEAAFAMGSNSSAQGPQSAAFGKSMFTRAAHSFVAGSYNESSDLPDPQNPAATDRIFQIGNGDNITRSNALTILRNGNLGIGNTDPSYPVDVFGQIRLRHKSGNNAGIWLNKSDNTTRTYVGLHSDNYLGLWSNSNPNNSGWGILMNTNNGNIGIGTTTTNALLQFPNNILNRKIVLWETANNDHQYYGLGINGGTFRYQVGSTGDNHVFYAGANSTTSNELFRIQGNGNAILAGTLTQLSDARLKKNIEPLQNSLEKLQHLNGYTYNWKDENNKTQQIGLIAQEVQQQFPQLVVESKDKLSVNYSGMIPVLLEAIKEQQKQIEKQDKRIETLENLLKK